MFCLFFNVSLSIQFGQHAICFEFYFLSVWVRSLPLPYTWDYVGSASDNMLLQFHSHTYTRMVWHTRKYNLLLFTVDTLSSKLLPNASIQISPHSFRARIIISCVLFSNSSVHYFFCPSVSCQIPKTSFVYILLYVNQLLQMSRQPNKRPTHAHTRAKEETSFHRDCECVCGLAGVCVQTISLPEKKICIHSTKAPRTHNGIVA